MLVLPEGRIVFAGPVGGPFRPVAGKYELCNTEPVPFNWGAAPKVGWLALSETNGSVPAKTTNTLLVSIHPVAGALGKGTYHGEIWITNTSSGYALIKEVTLIIGRTIVAWGNAESARVPDPMLQAVAISCGSFDTIALKKDGTVAAWGWNSYGQTNLPAGLRDVAAIAAGGRHCLALKTDGTVVAWGLNNRMQCDVPVGLANVVRIAAGDSHSLALRNDGTVVAWGAGAFVGAAWEYENSGQSIVPWWLTGMAGVAAGNYHSLALNRDGSGEGWGYDAYGQVRDFTYTTGIRAIAGGGYSSMALRNDGSVAVSGVMASLPLPVDLVNVTAVAAGDDFCMALKEDGTLVEWGRNDYFGETKVPPELGSVLGIAGGLYHSAALVNDGSVTKPLIHQQPLNRTAAEGTVAVFAVSATGPGRLWYQWKKNGQNLANGSSVAMAASPTLVLSDLQEGDSGTYSVVVSNVYGFMESSNAVLTVRDPGITSHPVSRTNLYGTTATFSVAASGSATLQYRWRKGGVELANGGNVFGATTSNLTLTAVSPADQGDYDVVVSIHKRSVISEPATLTVITAPEVTVHPMPRTKLPGRAVSFVIETRSPEPVSYRWVKDFTNIVDSARITGALGSRLDLKDLPPADAGEYRAIASNSWGSVTSAPARLNINVLRGYVQGWGMNNYGQLNVPGFADAVAVAAGDNRSLALRYGGTVVEWGENQYIPAGVSNVAAISANQHINLALMEDGTVGAWGWQDFGVTNVPPGLSNIVAVSAGYVFGSALKEDGTLAIWGYMGDGITNYVNEVRDVVAIAAGEQHLLALSRQGTVRGMGYNLYGQAAPPPGLSGVIAIAAGDRHSLALRSNGTVVAWGGNNMAQTNVPAGLTNVVAIAAGRFSSMAVLRNGSVVGWGNVTPLGGMSNIVAAAGGYNHGIGVLNNVFPPSFITVPASQTTAAGTNVIFTASVSGFEPSYQWSKNGIPLSDGGNVSGATSNRLILLDVLKADEGRYTLAASNVLGVAVSPEATLTVGEPVFRRRPVNQTNEIGTTAVFSGEAFGTPPLRYQWLKSGVELADGTKYSGVNEPTLNIHAVEAADAGAYFLRVTNVYGQITSLAAHLVVLQRPVILSQPASRTNITGSTATFEVSAAGTPPLSYQWFKDGATMVNGGRISGATAWMLAVAGVIKSDEGAYVVVVTSAFGQATSSPPALLTVPDPPQIIAQPTNQTNDQGTVAIFSVTATGVPPLSYRWRRDGVALSNGGSISGATTDTLRITGVLDADEGGYSVVVSGPGGSVTSSPPAWLVVTVYPLDAFTAEATGINASKATLRGVVAPHVVPATAWFEWGTNRTYGRAILIGNVDVDTGFKHVRADVGGLEPGGIIHFRIVASNSTQVVNGMDRQFITGGRVRAWGANTFGQCSSPPGVEELVSVAGGFSHSVGLRADGKVVAWGNDAYGQAKVPAGLEGVETLAAGGHHNLALQKDGGVVAWGRNDFGQGVSTNLTNVVGLSAGGSHNLALLEDGTVVAWGSDAQLQCRVPSGLAEVVQVAAGWQHSLALLADGRVVAWGADTYKQATVPIGLRDVAWVGAGLYHSLALHRDGHFTTWGYNGSGQAVEVSWTNAAAGACGGSHNLALLSDGTLDGWGYNFYGQGDIPAGLTNPVLIAAGGVHSLALLGGSYAPVDPAPVFVPQDCRVGTGGEFILSFTGLAGKSYSVWGSQSLVDWTWLGTAREFEAGKFELRDTGATNQGKRFYRVGGDF